MNTFQEISNEVYLHHTYVVHYTLIKSIPLISIEKWCDREATANQLAELPAITKQHAKYSL